MPRVRSDERADRERRERGRADARAAARARARPPAYLRRDEREHVAAKAEEGGMAEADEPAEADDEVERHGEDGHEHGPGWRTARSRFGATNGSASASATSGPTSATRERGQRVSHHARPRMPFGPPQQHGGHQHVDGDARRSSGQNTLPKVSASPISSAPIAAPATEPMPPSTTTTKERISIWSPMPGIDGRERRDDDAAERRERDADREHEAVDAASKWMPSARVMSRFSAPARTIMPSACADHEEDRRRDARGRARRSRAGRPDRTALGELDRAAQEFRRRRPSARPCRTGCWRQLVEARGSGRSSAAPARGGRARRGA